LVHWYENVPADAKLRDTEPLAMLVTLVGAPVAVPKVTLCTTPELLLQVTVPFRMIVTVEGLNALVAVP
jgi:hypothetical protein